MWRRTYLLLILVRLYFALSPSYLHPDENFQGPEVIAGTSILDHEVRNSFQVLGLPTIVPCELSRRRRNSVSFCNIFKEVLIVFSLTGQIFNYPVKLTWEFTSDHPVRSVFPLWPIYGLPMLLLRWIWIENGSDGEVTPVVVFWTLRVLMFVLSFVLEDWALHELVSSPRHRRVAVLLVASSYVTWTYQTHTFSNSIETLLVAWCLVLIHRIVEDRVSISPPFYLRRSLISIIATNISPRVRHTGIFICLRNIQPNYISSIPVYTWSSIDTTFYEKVSSQADNVSTELTIPGHFVY